MPAEACRMYPGATCLNYAVHCDRIRHVNNNEKNVIRTIEFTKGMTWYMKNASTNVVSDVKVARLSS